MIMVSLSERPKKTGAISKIKPVGVQKVVSVARASVPALMQSKMPVLL